MWAVAFIELLVMHGLELSDAWLSVGALEVTMLLLFLQGAAIPCALRTDWPIEWRDCPLPMVSTALEQYMADLGANNLHAWLFLSGE